MSESLPADGADALVFEGRDVFRRVAERAGCFELADQNRVSLDSDDQLVTTVDVEQAPSFGRDYDPPEDIDLACDAGVHNSLQ